MSWEKFEGYNDPEIPDKIVVSAKMDGKKIFIISIFISTGLIQVQGSAYVEWATQEFTQLEKLARTIDTKPEDTLQIIQSQKASSHIIEDRSDENDRDNEDNTTERIDSKVTNNNDKENYLTESSDEDSDEDSDDDSIVCSPSILKTLCNTVANLEREYLKQTNNLQQQTNNLQVSLETVLPFCKR